MLNQVRKQRISISRRSFLKDVTQSTIATAMAPNVLIGSTLAFGAQTNRSGSRAKVQYNTKEKKMKTAVSIVEDAFYINGEITYPGRFYQDNKIEGLLINTRMVQGIFDDRNPETVHLWEYPDTGEWDAERNTREFLAAMPTWRAHGVLAFTINLQGGSPEGYSKAQPWHNSGIETDGSLNPDYLSRLERIIDFADALGMVVILGYFYFGQDHRLTDENAVKQAVDNATGWIFDKGYTNVIVEVNNECNVRYSHENPTTASGT